MKAKSYSRKIFSFGPGGWKCQCCGPCPSQRKRARHRLRQIEKRFVARIEKIEADDDGR